MKQTRIITLLAAISVLIIGFMGTSASNAQVNCPSDTFIDVEQTSGAGGNYPAPQLNVSCSGATMTVTSNGIPTFSFVPTTPNDLQEQNYNWTIPLNPVAASEPSDVPLLGPIGITVSGLPIFAPNEAPRDGYGDAYLDGLLDYCNGHTAQGGVYHFHAAPKCMFTNFDGAVNLVVGYAFDGYPILAPYECTDSTCQTTYKVESSYQRTQDVRNTWDAHEYIAGLSNLDECNGMTDANGNYAYYATDSFPYFLGCYHGVPTLAGNALGGGQGATIQTGQQTNTGQQQGTQGGFGQQGGNGAVGQQPPNGQRPVGNRPPRQNG